MKAADYQHLVEESWRRPLSAEEQRQLAAWLKQHPEETGTWTEEAALTSALRRLPDAPVASNFTAQVGWETPSGISLPGCPWPLA